MTPAELKSARKALGLSQQGLADALGMHRSMIGYMETGRGPKGVPVAIERRTELAVKYLLDQAKGQDSTSI